MAESKHQPAADAPEQEWTAYLTGRGYVTEDQPRPVTNYKSFHGFWVPPRLGSKSAAVKTRSTKGTGRKRAYATVEKAWYAEKTLVALYQTERATFDKLVARISKIKQLVADQENAERIAEHRALLEPAVEAGMMNQAAADKLLEAWAKEQGIPLPTT